MQLDPTGYMSQIDFRPKLEEPDFKIISLSKYRLHFEMMNTDLSIANALRRIMIGEIQTMAVDLVEVKENSSALHDELITHRIGLVPLVSTSVDTFNVSNKCPCSEGMCSNCSVTFQIDVTCEGKELDVTTKHIIPTMKDHDMMRAGG